MKAGYSLYVEFEKDGTYLTMDQCHECDALCSGMIEQVLPNLIDWHDIESLDDVKKAYRWIKANIAQEYREISFTEYEVDEFGNYIMDCESFSEKWLM